jgi:hypothetical protein
MKQFSGNAGFPKSAALYGKKFSGQASDEAGLSGLKFRARFWGRASWDQIESSALRCGEAIRQEPREERIANTVERGDAAGDRRNTTL